LIEDRKVHRLRFAPLPLRRELELIGIGAAGVTTLRLGDDEFLLTTFVTIGVVSAKSTDPGPLQLPEPRPQQGGGTPHPPAKPPTVFSRWRPWAIFPLNNSDRDGRTLGDLGANGWTLADHAIKWCYCAHFNFCAQTNLL